MVIVKVNRSFVATHLVATGSGTESIELSVAVELGLRLHKGSAIVGHVLVAGIGVLAEEADGGRYDDHEE